jgi:hypothetical protein
MIVRQKQNAYQEAIAGARAILKGLTIDDE